MGNGVRVGYRGQLLVVSERVQSDSACFVRMLCCIKSIRKIWSYLCLFLEAVVVSTSLISHSQQLELQKCLMYRIYLM